MGVGDPGQGLNATEWELNTVLLMHRPTGRRVMSDGPASSARDLGPIQPATGIANHSFRLGKP